MNNNNDFSDDDNDEKCTCDEGYIEPHPCPFAEEVDGDSETLCTCCPFCTENCADTI